MAGEICASAPSRLICSVSTAACLGTPDTGVQDLFACERRFIYTKEHTLCLQAQPIALLLDAAGNSLLLRHPGEVAHAARAQMCDFLAVSDQVSRKGHWDAVALDNGAPWKARGVVSEEFVHASANSHLVGLAIEAATAEEARSVLCHLLGITCESDSDQNESATSSSDADSERGGAADDGSEAIAKHLARLRCFLSARS